MGDNAWIEDIDLPAGPDLPWNPAMKQHCIDYIKCTRSWLRMAVPALTDEDIVLEILALLNEHRDASFELVVQASNVRADGSQVHQFVDHLRAHVTVVSHPLPAYETLVDNRYFLSSLAELAKPSAPSDNVLRAFCQGDEYGHGLYRFANLLSDALYLSNVERQRRQ